METLLFCPLPSNAPPEFPRIILKSKNEKYVLDIKSSKIDFIIKDDQKSKTRMNYPVLLIKDYQNRLPSLSLSIMNVFKTKIIRLGFVLNLQFKVNDAVEIVKKFYIKDVGFTKNAFSLDIALLNKITLDNLESNMWFRTNTLRSFEKDKDNKILSVMFDINTVQEKILDLTDQDIIHFTKTSLEYLDTHLKNYLPEYNGRFNS